MRSGIKKSKSKYWKGKPRIRVWGDDVQHKIGCLPDKSAGGKVFSPNEADSNFLCDIGFCVLRCFRPDARAGNGKAS